MLQNWDRDEENRILKQAIREFPREWYHQNEWRIMLQGLGNWVIIAACVAITLSTSNPLVFIPAWIVTAARLHALGVLMHDFGHFLKMRRKPLRRLLVDFVLCYPILCNVDFFAHAHSIHHQNPNHPGKDPYYLPLNTWSVPGFLWATFLVTTWVPAWLTLRLAIYPLTIFSKRARELHIKHCSVFGPASLIGNPGPLMGEWFNVLWPVVPRFLVRRLGDEPLVDGPMPFVGPRSFELAPQYWPQALGPTVVWYSVAVVLTIQGWWLPFLWAYYIPIILMQPIFFWRLMSDHVSLEAEDSTIADQVNTVTNMEAPWWQEFLVGPHAAGYHGFHHVHPGVPNWYWKAAHERLKKVSPLYASTVMKDYFAVFRSMLDVHREFSRRKAAQRAAWAREVKVVEERPPVGWWMDIREYYPGPPPYPDEPDSLPLADGEETAPAPSSMEPASSG